jgi:hypothetical protein
MPWVGFEPTVPASARAKIVHALDRSVTVTGRLDDCWVIIWRECGRKQFWPNWGAIPAFSRTDWEKSRNLSALPGGSVTGQRFKQCISLIQAGSITAWANLLDRINIYFLNEQRRFWLCFKWPFIITWTFVPQNIETNVILSGKAAVWENITGLSSNPRSLCRVLVFILQLQGRCFYIVEMTEIWVFIS